MPPFKFSLFRRHSLKAQLRQNMAKTEEGFCMIFAMESGDKKSQALIRHDRHENSEIFGNTQLFQRKSYYTRIYISTGNGSCLINALSCGVLGVGGLLLPESAQGT
jgi:hypothetical protein